MIIYYSLERYFAIFNALFLTLYMIIIFLSFHGNIYVPNDVYTDRLNTKAMQPIKCQLRNIRKLTCKLFCNEENWLESVLQRSIFFPFFKILVNCNVKKTPCTPVNWSHE